MCRLPPWSIDPKKFKYLFSVWFTQAPTVIFTPRVIQICLTNNVLDELAKLSLDVQHATLESCHKYGRADFKESKEEAQNVLNTVLGVKKAEAERKEARIATKIHKERKRAMKRTVQLCQDHKELVDRMKQINPEGNKAKVNKK